MKVWISHFVLICLTQFAFSQNMITQGPETGTLLIIGGSASDIFYDKFMDLIGGPDEPIVVIPTAASSNELSQEYLENYRQRYLERGFTNVTVLHTRDPDESNNPSFYEPILQAKGVWFSGGRQWRHADSYLNTKTHEAFWDVLNRGGVIAGSSAGATIQGSYLARGDTKANTIMMGDHEAGLGFMTNVAIDQHLFARNRQFDMFEILDRKPELLGIGLDEDTGIVVQGDRFRVFGNSYVVVYDRTRWSRERDTIYHLPQGSKEFYLLKRGEEYDLSKRKIVEFGERKFINLSDEELKIYAGTYTSENGARTIDLVREEGKLFLHQQRNNQRHQLYPESTIHFVRENSNFTLDFRMSEGEIEGLYLPLQDLHLYKK